MGNQKQFTDEELQVVYDHYKDTFTHILEHEKKRDWFLLLTVLALLLGIFQSSSPSQAQSVLAQILQSKLNVTLSNEVSAFVNGIIWFGLFVLVVKYFQSVIHIDRQYPYHESIEKVLSNHFQNSVFKRESDAYKLSKPKFSILVKWFYKLIFPALLLTLVIWRIVLDFVLANISPFSFGFNLIVATFIIIAISFYLLWIHFKR